MAALTDRLADGLGRAEDGAGTRRGHRAVSPCPLSERGYAMTGIDVSDQDAGRP